MAIWVQAAGQTVTDPLTALIGLGPVGIIAFLFIIGKIRTEGEVKRLTDNLDKKDEQIASLQKSIMEQAIPAVVKATEVLQEIAPLLREGRR